MTISEIKLRPNCFITNYEHVMVEPHGDISGMVTYKEARCHESLLRAYQILDKTKEWLRLGTPASVVLEMIEEIEETDKVPPYKHEDE